ncbi:MAG: hypothetical protein RLZ98_673 [Pseudomonadota bacterium]|jgi:carboxymethylenebutenolidase
MGRTIDFAIGDVKTTAYVASPEGAGPFPGVVVAFHKEGIDAFTEWVVDDLARNGYAAIAPNHYHVLPSMEYIEKRRDYLTDKQLSADVKAAADWLVSDGNTEPGRRAILGHCMGGRTTWLGLVSLPGVFKCGCPFYGGGSFQALGEGPAPVDQLENIAGPVMGFFGNNDKNPSPADADEISRRLTAFGKRHVFHRYDDTPHAFMDWANKSFNAASSKDAWPKALQFLSEQIGGGAGKSVFPY